jgi:hypothetical protein
VPPNYDQKDRIRLHIRVPHGSRLKIDARQGGNIAASGELSDVEATTPSGSIRVSGATGAMKLITSNGEIQVDNREGALNQRLELYARNGSITVFSVGASVTAVTTVGNIRFIGSLFGIENSFTTTGSGKVLVALPNDIPHRFAVEGSGPVTVDFMAAALTCGWMTNASAGLKVEQSPDTVLGKIVASDSAITPTKVISGTMGKYAERPYLHFESNHGQIIRRSPSNGGNAVQALWSPDCDKVRSQGEPNGVNFRVRAERGDVAIRLIRKHP